MVEVAHFVSGTKNSLTACTEASDAMFPLSVSGGRGPLSEERERHILARHPELIPRHRQWIAATLEEPDEVRRSARFGTARLFSRWCADLREGKHVLVVVVSEPDADRRHWIVTAYAA